MSNLLLDTREAGAKALVKLGTVNPNIVVLEADLSQSSKTTFFSKKFPDRFFQMGIAEQNEFAVAAGMAMSGKIPFVSTYAVFATMKACEQIRTYIAYPNLNVKIIASHGGLTPGKDGATHQAIEDLGIMRSIPNMTIIAPADAIATESLVYAAVKIKGPVYIRLSRAALPVIYEMGNEFIIGKALELCQGLDATIIAIGDMVSWAVKVAEELKKDNVSIRVIDMHTLKPLDREIVIKSAKETGALITVEDHNIYGGLGSAVAEVVAEEIPVPFKRVGIKDIFGESGEYHLLLDKYGLGVNDIKASVMEVIKNKKNKIWRDNYKKN